MRIGPAGQPAPAANQGLGRLVRLGAQAASGECVAPARVGGEDACVADHVKARRGHEGAQAPEQLSGREAQDVAPVGEGAVSSASAASRRGLGQAVERERGAQAVAREAFRRMRSFRWTAMPACSEKPSLRAHRRGSGSSTNGSAWRFAGRAARNKSGSGWSSTASSSRRPPATQHRDDARDDAVEQRRDLAVGRRVELHEARSGVGVVADANEDAVGAERMEVERELEGRVEA